MPLLECHDVWKVYSEGTEALKGIECQLDAGLYGLLGPNGAGKTTLMEILTLRLEPTRGTISVNGISARKDPMGIRRAIGYLPQHVGFHPELSAQEFLEYVTRLSGYSRRQAKQRAMELLELVNLQNVGRERLGTYSGGMLRRVGIAQALASDPRIVIVDEPTAGLDPEERIRFRNLLFQLGTDRLVILSTHIVADVEETCTNIGLLLQGELAYHGSAQAFITAASGSTWECDGSIEDLEPFASTGRLVQSREIECGIRYRLVGEKPDRPSWSVEPNLEDAYVYYLMRRGVLTATSWEVASHES